jgi:tRNA modification GTPase
MENLLRSLTVFAREQFESREPALVTRERQRLALADASAALARALANGAGRDDILAEELRLAALSKTFST